MWLLYLYFILFLFYFCSVRSIEPTSKKSSDLFVVEKGRSLKTGKKYDGHYYLVTDAHHVITAP